MVITNNSDEVISTGNYFIIEKWNGKTWVKEKARSNMMFTSIGYLIGPGEIRHLETDIAAYYPDLKKGTYKISTSYFYEKDIPITRDEEHWISHEFKIE